MAFKTWSVWSAVVLATSGVGMAAQVGSRAPGEPQPAVDTAALERGQGLYAVACASCHGSEARGGESGPNLLRSAVMLDDRNGERLVPVVRSGRPESGMPPRPDLTDVQVRDLAAFLRTLRTTGRDPGRNRPATIVVGNAADGQAYFAVTCAKCHSVTGDLKSLASRYLELRQLQQAWLAGTAAGRPPSPTIIIVTLPSGERVEGQQARLDDFIVSLRMPDGSTRTFSRTGDVPRLEIRDPLQAHRDLVPRYSDRDVHNMTAYLVTLK
jgi:cytochrome c oxidase cbb3-type subunit III